MKWQPFVLRAQESVRYANGGAGPFKMWKTGFVISGSIGKLQSSPAPLTFSKLFMAIVRSVKSKNEASKLTERDIQKDIFFLWTDGYTSFPNVNLFGWEMDLALVSSSNYLTEIEVKLTLSDWKRDCEKEKFTNIQYHPKRFKYVKYFYYAVPEKLLSKMPDHVAADTGIISINENRVVKIERKSVARKGCEKLTSRLIAQLYSKFYWRYRWWDKRWDPKQRQLF